MLFTAVLVLLATLFQIGFANAHTPTKTHSGHNNNNQFVRTENGKFMLGDKPFQYIGTSAYWLQLLDNDDDMNKTLSEIASRGIKVVRTWAFNDVTDIPPSGVYLRIFHSNGTIELNTGENGILRLDRIVRVAESVGIHILFSLTNNWFPRASNITTSAASPKLATRATGLNGDDLPRNYLSNDYGGMDTYVKHFSNENFHDTFYTDDTIINSFKDYVKTIVTRYSNETNVFGWEVANDPRCNSTFPSSTGCNPQTVTQWTSELSQHVKQQDPNHLVSSGDSGFYCVDCTKLFPFVPPPTPSSAPGKRRIGGPLTRAKLLAKDLAWKKRNLPGFQRKSLAGGRSIRGGRWFAPADAGTKKRQSNGFGPIYDGSFGVDTEDISNIPSVDFSSFQLFPDQNSYGPVTQSGVSNFTEVVQSGIDWIEQHAATANTFGKPASLNGFGLVTNVTSNSFAPFNSSVVQQSSVGTTPQQQVSAYGSWINSAINSGVQGITQYQWGESNITSSSSTAITHQSSVGTISNSSTNTFFSPNDGYASYDDAVKAALEAGAASIANATSGVARRSLLRKDYVQANNKPDL